MEQRDDIGGSSTPSAAATPRWRRLAPDVGMCVAVPAIVVACFAPAMNREFSHDTICYLANREGSSAIRDGLRLLDYDTNARYNGYAPVLFRPLYFTSYLLIYALAEHRSAVWHWTFLVLHAGLCLALYRLVRTVHPPVVAGLWALIFGLHPAGFYHVVWTEGGKTFPLILLVLAFVPLRRLLESGERWDRRTLAAYLLCMTGAAFGQELAVCVAILAAVCIGLRYRAVSSSDWVRKAALAAVPAALYAVAYSGHWLAGSDLSWVRPSQPGSAENAAQAAWMIGGKFVSESALPGLINFAPEPYAITFVWLFPTSSSAVHVNLIAIALALIAGALAFSPEALRRERWFLGLIAAAIACYVALLCIGRDSLAIRFSPTYTYVFLLLAAAGLPMLFSVSGRGDDRRKLAIAVLLVWAAWSAFLTRGWAEWSRAFHEPYAAYMARLGEFVEQRRDEPGFSFDIENPPEKLDPIFLLSDGRPFLPETPLVGKRVSSIIFYRHHDPHDPRYRLRWTGRGFHSREIGLGVAPPGP